MRSAARRFPADNEIAVLHADALMNLAPWDYWEAGGARLKPAVAELVPTLERVLKKQPEHQGAIHLYIHAVEASDNPRRAERYADRLGKLAPAAGHLVHMPSHIYYRVGRYKDSLAVNRTAVKVDETYIDREKATGLYALGYYPHNVHFVMVSAEMAGDGAAVVEAANKLARIIPDEAARAFPMVQPMKAAPYFAHARFSDPATVMALPDPGADLPYIQAVWRYARGVVMAQQGKSDEARAELAHIERLVGSTDYRRFTEANIPAREVMQIAAHMLRARIAQMQNDLSSAVAGVQAAVKLYDGLPYMEPPYWPYPVRQTLGALLVLQGEHERARSVFAEALARTPNNAWALYGLREAYARDGKTREARAVDRRLSGLWIGGRGRLDLATL
jgi:tetratricopeptide (TPR) repeat protein